jgi:NADH-quinone oxidoreductase subunit J
VRHDSHYRDATNPDDARRCALDARWGLAMLTAFYVSAAVAVIATVMVVTRSNAMHALLYLVISLLALALMLYLLGAPFVAALEVVVYAGAIVVLFVFAVMAFDLGPRSVKRERRWLSGRGWFGPAVLAALLFAELVYLLIAPPTAAGTLAVAPKQVGLVLFRTYWLGVELASTLLLGGLVAAYHLGRSAQLPRRKP